MLKSIKDKVFSFDMEWVPDVNAGQILYGEYSMDVLWKNSGKQTEEDPIPFIKPILCKIVSCSGILREIDVEGEPMLSLITLSGKEVDIIRKVLRAIGRSKPQIVGYNSKSSDWPILVQRAIVNGMSSYGVAERPDKPWEGIDYYKNEEYNIDLADCLVAGYQNKPTLNEVARLSGIPGKFDNSGEHVAQMYLDGRIDEIIQYNEFDAFTTHLLWARCARFSDLLSEDEYFRENDLVKKLLEEEISEGKTHLNKFLEEWDRLIALTVF